MAYNQILANQIREQLQELDGIEEKEMMGGLSFMLIDKRTGLSILDWTGS